jgi:hypothetical protein
LACNIESAMGKSRIPAAMRNDAILMPKT